MGGVFFSLFVWAINDNSDHDNTNYKNNYKIKNDDNNNTSAVGRLIYKFQIPRMVLRAHSTDNNNSVFFFIFAKYFTLFQFLNSVQRIWNIIYSTVRTRNDCIRSVQLYIRPTILRTYTHMVFQQLPAAVGPMNCMSDTHSIKKSWCIRPTAYYVGCTR